MYAWKTQLWDLKTSILKKNNNLQRSSPPSPSRVPIPLPPPAAPRPERAGIEKEKKSSRAQLAARKEPGRRAAPAGGVVARSGCPRRGGRRGRRAVGAWWVCVCGGAGERLGAGGEAGRSGAPARARTPARGHPASRSASSRAPRARGLERRRLPPPPSPPLPGRPQLSRELCQVPPWRGSQMDTQNFPYLRVEDENLVKTNVDVDKHNLQKGEKRKRNNLLVVLKGME
ncbi:laforin-like [Bos taurus]|uniref:laforin-like n=1 Tax=Bos taurus TaxID=9913 RepID=UPI0028CB2B48|nr:laforin-like [Bos taurus]